MPSVVIDDISQPAAIVCRQLARELLNHATAASARLANPDDAQALHDARVAIRRLRTCLRAYRSWLRPVVGPKAYRQLKRITRRTNSDRDAQVHLEWIDRQLQRKRVPPRIKQGLEQLRTAAGMDLSEGLNQNAGAIQSRLDRLARKMADRLADLAAPENPECPPDSFANATAEIVSKLRDRLHADFERISLGDDQSAAHDARLTAKRIRYVLEPLRKRVPRATEVIRNCSRLQDLVGAHRDLQTLESRARDLAEREAIQWARSELSRAMDRKSRQWRSAAAGSHSMVPLIRRLWREQERMFARLQRQWLGQKSAQFLASIDAVIVSLRGQKGPASPASLDDTGQRLQIGDDLFHAA